MTSTIAAFSDAAEWERTLYAFLAEKERRSGSRRTVETYSRMLFHFFGTLGKRPDQVTAPDVFTYAHSVGLSGKEPSSVTIGARIACLSSFYRFLIRMGLETSNPCDKLERPSTTPAPPRGLSAGQIRQLLDSIPDTPVGIRDKAIILMLTLTGRRRRGRKPEGGRPGDRRRGVLLLQRQGRQEGTSRVTGAGIPSHRDCAGSLQQDSSYYGARRIPLALKLQQ